MNIKTIIKEIDGVFVLPKKVRYFGKEKFGTPYFNPIGYKGNIMSIRKLKLITKEESDRYAERYPLLNQSRSTNFSNLPLVRRNKYWIKKIFGNYYYIEIGWPFAIHNGYLGWKDKFGTPAYEWQPSFQIYFFGFQYCEHWNSPDDDNNNYYEQILWYLKYSNKDIDKARETWSWQDMDTQKSTWKDEYITN